MSKKKLSLDDLKVESFQTTPDAEGPEKGTVYGFAYTEETACATSDCCTGQTCAQTCGWTCGHTSWGTCAASCDTCGSTCYC